MKWINVFERLPTIEEDKDPILITDGEYISFGALSDNKKYLKDTEGDDYRNEISTNEITHWMRIELPKKDHRELD